MRSLRTACFALMLSTVVAAVASADPVTNDTYFIAPGAGFIDGFQLAGGPFELSTLDFASEEIGLDITGSGIVTSSDALIQNTATNFDLTLRLETTGNFLPDGSSSDTGGILETLGLFVGGGIDPLDFNQPVFANTAVIEVFDSAEGSLGLLDVVGLQNFTSGVGGGWDGSVGINFNSAIEIGDVSAIEFRVNYDIDAAAVPEPTAGLIALSALSLTLRRRRIA